jgi:hypothetical protein
MDIQSRRMHLDMVTHITNLMIKIHQSTDKRAVELADKTPQFWKTNIWTF